MSTDVKGPLGDWVLGWQPIQHTLDWIFGWRVDSGLVSALDGESSMVCSVGNMDWRTADIIKSFYEPIYFNFSGIGWGFKDLMWASGAPSELKHPTHPINDLWGGPSPEESARFRFAMGMLWNENIASQPGGWFTKSGVSPYWQVHYIVDVAESWTDDTAGGAYAHAREAFIFTKAQQQYSLDTHFKYIGLCGYGDECYVAIRPRSLIYLRPRWSATWSGVSHGERKKGGKAGASNDPNDFWDMFTTAGTQTYPLALPRLSSWHWKKTKATFVEGASFTTIGFGATNVPQHPITELVGLFEQCDNEEKQYLARNPGIDDPIPATSSGLALPLPPRIVQWGCWAFDGAPHSTFVPACTPLDQSLHNPFSYGGNNTAMDYELWVGRTDWMAWTDLTSLGQVTTPLPAWVKRRSKSLVEVPYGKSVVNSHSTDDSTNRM